MEATAHSSAPQALRGAALRAALRVATGGEQRDTPSCPEPFSEAAFSVRMPAQTPALPDPPDAPESAGPAALRPGELARWLERNR
jgi:hypothetical protein